MATTMFFEETLKDKTGKAADMDFEIGRSSYVGGDGRIYMVIDGKALIVDHEQGKKLVEAVYDLGRYLSYIE